MSAQQMTAPTGSNGGLTKNPNAELLKNDFYPAIMVGLVDCGTQNDEYKGTPRKTRTLKMIFEFPTHKQLFYLEDTEPKPAQLSKEFTYVMSVNKTTGKKSNLYNCVESIYGPTPQNPPFDFSRMIGQLYTIKVGIKNRLKDGTPYNIIDAIGPFSQMYQSIVHELVPSRDPFLYNLGHGFDSMEFAVLPNWIRRIIKESDEAKTHALNGGYFSYLDENKSMQFEQISVQATGPVQQQQGKVVMKDPNHSYQNFKNNGWSDQQIVEHGYGYFQPVAAAPSAPVAPPPVPAPAPVLATPAINVRMFHTCQYSYESLIQAGWNDKQIVESGYGVYINPPTPAPAPAPAPAPVATLPPAPTPAPAPAPAVVPPPATFATTVASPPAQANTPVAPPVAPPANTPVAPPPGAPASFLQPAAPKTVADATAAFMGATAGTPPAPNNIPDVAADFDDEEHDDLPF